MSYDVYLRGDSETCPTCGRDAPGPEDGWHPTYNLTPIFDRALTGEELPNPDVGEISVVLFRTKTDRPRGLRLLDGRIAGDTAEWLEKALRHLKDPANEATFRALEPENKWGVLENAISVMGELAEAAREWPKHKWSAR
jgi:hypothetical protein